MKKKAASRASSADNKAQSIVCRLVTAAVLIVLTAVDLLLKYAARKTLAAGRVIRFGSFIGLRYVENTGAAFSMFSEKTAILSVCTGILLLAVLGVLFSGKVRNRLLHAALTMVTAGGIGNWIDRLRLGYVIDYIEPLFMRFAVFNFADCLITVGAAMIVVWLIFDTLHSAKEKKKESAP